MTDLFDKRTAKEKLFDWMKTKNWCRTSDVLRWGTENFSNRADRNARQLCRDGLIRRMTDDEKMSFFKKRIMEDVWVRMDFK